MAGGSLHVTLRGPDGQERDLTAAIEAVKGHFSPDRVQMMHITRGILVE